jgi:hypothetical protein
MAMMKQIEVDYDKDIICPFCKKVLVDMSVEEDYETCEHTIFIATSYGMEYTREDLEYINDEEPTLSDYSKYLDDLSIDYIRIDQYSPAPSLMGEHWGFME